MPPSSLPPADAAATAAAFLATLLGDDTRFRSSTAIGLQLAGATSPADPKAVATQARKAKRILGVWDGEKYRYPAFQFDAAGQPRQDLPALIAVLPRDADGSHRAAALWLFAPTAALGSRTPAEVFPDDPARVIALARTWHEGGPD